MSVTRTGGRYVRDQKTGAIEQVEGPALRAAQAAQAATPATPAAPPAKTKAAPPADGEKE